MDGCRRTPRRILTIRDNATSLGRLPLYYRPPMARWSPRAIWRHSRLLRRAQGHLIVHAALRTNRPDHTSHISSRATTTAQTGQDREGEVLHRQIRRHARRHRPKTGVSVATLTRSTREGGPKQPASCPAAEAASLSAGSRLTPASGARGDVPSRPSWPWPSWRWCRGGPRDRAAAVGSRAAALIDADSGQTLFGQNPNSRRAIASTTKLMTALITLEHVHHLGRCSPRTTTVGRRGLADRAGAGRADERARPDAALMLPSADDAAEDLAFNVGHGSVARFVGMMNAERASWASPTPITRRRSGSTPPATTRAPRTWSSWPLRDRIARRSSGARWRCPARPAYRASTSARSTTATTSSAATPGSTASRPAIRIDAGYVLVASGTQGGAR